MNGVKIMGRFDGSSSAEKAVLGRGCQDFQRNLVYWGSSAFLTLFSHTVPSKSCSLQAEGALSSALTLMRILFGRGVERRTWSIEETGWQDPSLSTCLCTWNISILIWHKLWIILQEPWPKSTSFLLKASVCLDSVSVCLGVPPQPPAARHRFVILVLEVLESDIGQLHWLKTAAGEVFRKITQAPYDISRLIVTKEIHS